MRPIIMKIFITLILSALGLSAFAQKADNRIVIGTADTVYSKVLNEKRVIFIHVPAGGKGERYPVLYLLDGESHFNSAVGIVQQMAGVIPDMVIVGITNTMRERDLTPTHVKPSKLISQGEANQAGGGEAFLKFINDELFPYIDGHYPTLPYRVFSGHSLGGLTVVNALVNHTAMFNAYIAIDPSLWWDNENWVNQIKANLPKHNFKNKSLFVAIANNLRGGMDTISILKDTTNSAPVTHAVIPFVQTLRAIHPGGLRWGSKFYPNERHGTVELIAEYDALRYLFSYYQFRTSQFEGHPELDEDSVLEAHFKLVSANFGCTINPSEDTVNELAYNCLGRKKFTTAYKLFIRNITIYPQSANAYDSLGDYYVARGDKQKAIEAFSKSLRLQEGAETRQKLEELKKK
jgi:predicted alpha/beta superfamily hydrolase